MWDLSHKKKKKTACVVQDANTKSDCHEYDPLHDSHRRRKEQWAPEHPGVPPPTLSVSCLTPFLKLNVVHRRRAIPRRSARPARHHREGVFRELCHLSSRHFISSHPPSSESGWSGGEGGAGRRRPHIYTHPCTSVSAHIRVTFPRGTAFALKPQVRAAKNRGTYCHYVFSGCHSTISPLRRHTCNGTLGAICKVHSCAPRRRPFTGRRPSPESTRGAPTPPPTSRGCEEGSAESGNKILTQGTESICWRGSPSPRCKAVKT